MQLELQQKLPFEDLRQRLAYEGRSDVYTTDPLEKPQRPPLKKPEGPGEPTFTLNSLNERTERLRRLHHATTEEFINSPNFGRSRTVLGPTPGSELLLEPGGPLAADEPTYRPDTLGPETPFRLKAYEQELWQHGKETKLDIILTSSTPARSTFSDFDLQSKDIFANANRLGYVESLDRVAGFLPHQFWQKPEMGTGRSAQPPHLKGNRTMQQYESQKRHYDRWQNTRLQLVSLLKHPEPRVYLSEHLPAMPELENAETRCAG